jgi:hypothetical protein
MKSIWRRLRAWREARRERYTEQWTATKPYDSRGDKYLPPTSVGPDSLPPSG